MACSGDAEHEEPPHIPCGSPGPPLPGLSGRCGTALIAPSGDDVINEGDTLVVFGPDAKLQEFERGALTAQDPM
ncbi:MAG: TrkA C-terminal domain-containing protein [Victivallales bacterium]|nr:TrkA C-terminal domain-containing protein [Victivallales bacterium]